MSTRQDSSSDFLEVPTAALNVSEPAVHGRPVMSLDENSYLHELAACRQEKRTSRLVGTLWRGSE